MSSRPSAERRGHPHRGARAGTWTAPQGARRGRRGRTLRGRGDGAAPGAGGPRRADGRSRGPSSRHPVHALPGPRRRRPARPGGASSTRCSTAGRRPSGRVWFHEHGDGASDSGAAHRQGAGRRRPGAGSSPLRPRRDPCETRRYVRGRRCCTGTSVTGVRACRRRPRDRGRGAGPRRDRLQLDRAARRGRRRRAFPHGGAGRRAHPRGAPAGRPVLLRLRRRRAMGRLRVPRGRRRLRGRVPDARGRGLRVAVPPAACAALLGAGADRDDAWLQALHATVARGSRTGCVGGHRRRARARSYRPAQPRARRPSGRAGPWSGTPATTATRSPVTA